MKKIFDFILSHPIEVSVLGFIKISLIEFIQEYQQTTDILANFFASLGKIAAAIVVCITLINSIKNNVVKPLIKHFKK
jgi:hypothetical protein